MFFNYWNYCGLYYSFNHVFFSEFPAFQNLLLELNFPSVVIGMFECDEESYVRASAIICLQKMVSVKKLWDEALSDKKLLVNLFSLFNLLINSKINMYSCKLSLDDSLFLSSF